MSKISVGNFVRTVASNGRTDWTELANRGRCRWGVLGRVIERETGHGLCYTVQHDDGVEVAYDHDEVEFVSNCVRPDLIGSELVFDKVSPVCDTLPVNKTYNVATGIPAQLLREVGRLHDLELVWSRHAKSEAVNDKYGVLPPHEYPRRFFANSWQIVEVEANAAGHVVKFVVRRPVDETRSLVLVILRDGPHTGLVKTVFLNLNTDNHATLDASKFAKP